MPAAQSGTIAYAAARSAPASPAASRAEPSRSVISWAVFGIALSGQASAHSMHAVQAAGSNTGTVRRKMPLFFPAPVPTGMNMPVPGSTGASLIVPSRNGRATISS